MFSIRYQGLYIEMVDVGPRLQQSSRFHDAGYVDTLGTPDGTDETGEAHPRRIGLPHIIFNPQLHQFDELARDVVHIIR